MKERRRARWTTRIWCILGAAYWIGEVLAAAAWDEAEQRWRLRQERRGCRPEKGQTSRRTR